MSISTAVLTLVLLYFLGSLWPKFVIDETRQKLFEVRDAFFDYARGGGIGFNHPAYGCVREHINALIQITHVYSIEHVLLCAWVLKRDMSSLKSEPNELDSLVDDLSDAQKRKLQNTYDEALGLIGHHVLRRSFLLNLLITMVTVFSAPARIRASDAAARLAKFEVRHA
jgi:hypothetical protein